MPYKKYERTIDGQKRYVAENIETGQVVRYYTPENRETGIRMHEAFSHGFKPRGLAGASRNTRTRVSSMGGRAKGRR